MLKKGFYIFLVSGTLLLSYSYFPFNQNDHQIHREPQSVAILPLDHRLSVSHISGIYPLITNGTYLEYGAQDALHLGFQNIEIYLHPTVCYPRTGLPKGIYQNIESIPELNWCSNTDYGNGAYDYQLKNEYRSLERLVSNNIHYQRALNLPFRTFFLTVDPINYGVAAYSIATGSPAEFTQAQFDAQYEEMYNLTVYLLHNYKNTGKIFILQTNNEADWAIVNAKGKQVNISIKNTINLWNNAQNAINDAKHNYPTSGVKVYQGCEVNKVLKAINKGKTATNNVVPATYCDLYGYSAYDTIWPLNANYNSKNFLKALQYLEKKARPSQDFGEKNIYISEFGFREDLFPMDKKISTQKN